MPDDTYVLPTSVSAQEEDIWVTNVGEEDVTVSKGCRIGYISRNGVTSTHECSPEISKKSHGKRKQTSTKASVSTAKTPKASPKPTPTPIPTPIPTPTPETIKISQTYEHRVQSVPINQGDTRTIETSEVTMAVHKEPAKPAKPANPSEHVTALVPPPVDVPDRMCLEELAIPSERGVSQAPTIPPLIDTDPEKEELQAEVSPASDEQEDVDEDPLHMAKT